DPTMMRMLQDLTGIDPRDIPMNDESTMRIFSSTDVLGVTPEQIKTKMATYGIPEFGTKFVRQMLEDTNPTTFAELVQISGLSHGTDVWLNNAQELVRAGTAVLKDVIGCRDDIMVYLIHKGVEFSLAFKITESVRRGKGLTSEWIDEMRKHDVPTWYIESCLKIKYMFPKAHAAAYVLSAVRTAYFKVHHPIAFYATYFTVRADDFDIEICREGYDAIRRKVDEIEANGLDASPKERSLLTILEMALEMTARGLLFDNIDLYRSDSTKFLIDGDKLIPPFSSIQGVGTNAAKSIIKARQESTILSKEDLGQRSRVTKSVIELLDRLGSLEGLPDSNQLTLF
ncbi:MAG: PolC-type DNA polymerase III, partial [Bacilli bacterium]